MISQAKRTTNCLSYRWRGISQPVMVAWNIMDGHRNRKTLLLIILVQILARAKQAESLQYLGYIFFFGDALDDSQK